MRVATGISQKTKDVTRKEVDWNGNERDDENNGLKSRCTVVRDQKPLVQSHASHN